MGALEGQELKNSMLSWVDDHFVGHARKFGNAPCSSHWEPQRLLSFERSPKGLKVLKCKSMQLLFPS